MGRQEVEKNKKLEVHVVFEASRVASECLSEAYERVVPITRRTIHPESKPALDLIQGSELAPDPIRGQALEKDIITQAQRDRTPDPGSGPGQVLVRGRACPELDSGLWRRVGGAQA